MTATDAAEDEIDAIVEAYESQVAETGQADLVEFLPAVDHPLYADALRELVRVDLEFSWRSGVHRRIEYYLERLPRLRDDRDALAAIGYEECRLRRRAGERPTVAEYVQRLGVAPRDEDEAFVDEPPVDVMTQVAHEYLKTGLSTAKEPITRAADEAPPTRLFAAIHRDDPKQATALAEALTQFPESGSVLGEYNLERELGRGAFGRVYLARQRDLAGRPVVVKLTADAGSESAAMARLQHTNIVPIYSAHRWKPHHAIVMPFAGRTTLFDVVTALRSSGMPTSGQWLVELVQSRESANVGREFSSLWKCSYESAIVRLAAKLAAGLAHAHDRGIIHRDLKPANVLLSDDGEPMLLDFNLAKDQHLRSKAEAAQVGGTLPYMAPEQLLGFETLGPQGDTRADVYAFGLVLFELLTGNLPWLTPKGHVMEICRQLRALRAGPLPKLPRVRPALQAIIHKCLAHDPDNRYPSARELLIDLERQRDDLPLQYAANPSLRERVGKWIRRHPRMASGYSVAAAALLALAGAGALLQNQRTTIAANRERDAERTFQQQLAEARRLLAAPYPEGSVLQRGMAAAKAAADPANQHREGYAEAMLTQARGLRMYAHYEPRKYESYLDAATRCNDRALELWPESQSKRAPLLQRSLMSKSASDLQRALAMPIRDVRDQWLAGIEYLAAGNFHQAKEHLDAARIADPRAVIAWSSLGQAYLGLDEPDRAVPCFETAIALAPECAEYHHWLGMAHYRRGDFPAALRGVDAALKLMPGNADIRGDRGLILLAAGHTPAAIIDLTAAIDAGDAPAKLYFARARARKNKADLDEAFRQPARSEADWAARAIARLPGDPTAAKQDLERGLERLGVSRLLLENLAHVTDEYLNKPTDAIEALNLLLSNNPYSAQHLASRGVLHARQDHDSEARRDALAALKLTDRPEVVYQVAGIYALLGRKSPGDREQAILLLAEALHRGYGLQHVDRDPDIASIRNAAEVKKLIEGVRSRKK